MMKANSATTFQARCRLAATYVERYRAQPASVWVAIGKLTDWVDDNNPPLPSLTMSQVPELYGFLYVHTCKSVYTNPDGNLRTSQGAFTSVESTNPAVLASSKANKVFFEGMLSPDVWPTDAEYRIQALCTDVVFNTSLPPLQPGVFMTADSVRYYFVDWVSHHTPIRNDGFTKQIIQIVRVL